MRIGIQKDDAPEFISRAEALLNGAAQRYKPQEFLLIKINNWFSEKWFRFSGKYFGLVGVRKFSRLTVPPFVPNRVVWQRAFSGPEFEEIEPGPPLHKAVSSTRALERNMDEAIQDAGVLWFSGNSEKTGRGSVMVYAWDGTSFQNWYTGWAKNDVWRLTVMRNISREQLKALIWDAFNLDDVLQKTPV